MLNLTLFLSLPGSLPASSPYLWKLMSHFHVKRVAEKVGRTRWLCRAVNTEGAGGQLPPPVFVISVNPSPTRAQILPTIILPACPLQIFRPSYGPAIFSRKQRGVENYGAILTHRRRVPSKRCGKCAYNADLLCQILMTWCWQPRIVPSCALTQQHLRQIRIEERIWQILTVTWNLLPKNMSLQKE